MIEAQIVADNISPEGHRLITFQLRYPKFIHGELMTHRVFSRNASSSRAIPVAKYLEEVRSDTLRATPVHWGAEQKGMSSGEELSSAPSTGWFYRYPPKYKAILQWRKAALAAADQAEKLVTLGVHKSLVNRVLEPFIHINVVVTATEYMNFFGLRLDKGAQPEIRVLAETMWRAYKASIPYPMTPGMWHLPYVEGADYEASGWEGGCLIYDKAIDKGLAVPIKMSVARCARVSYLSFETGKRSTVTEDLKLYDRLVGSKPVHASPAEHQATPDSLSGPIGGLVTPTEWQNPGQHANYTGWRQYRKMLDGEAIAPLPPGYVVA